MLRCSIAMAMGAKFKKDDVYVMIRNPRKSVALL